MPPLQLPSFCPLPNRWTAQFRKLKRSPRAPYVVSLRFFFLGGGVIFFLFFIFFYKQVDEVWFLSGRKALFGIFVLDFFVCDGSQALSQLQSQTAELKQ